MKLGTIKDTTEAPPQRGRYNWTELNEMLSGMTEGTYKMVPIELEENDKALEIRRTIYSQLTVFAKKHGFSVTIRFKTDGNVITATVGKLALRPGRPRTTASNQLEVEKESGDGAEPTEAETPVRRTAGRKAA